MNLTTVQLARLKRRHRSDRRFKYYGMAAIAFALAFLSFFFVDIISKSLPAFEQAYIQVPVTYSASIEKIITKLLAAIIVIL